MLMLMLMLLLLLLLSKDYVCLCFEWVGQAYVHGIMHGEALSSIPSTREYDGAKTLGIKEFQLT